MQDDALSDVLRLVSAHSVVSGGLAAGGAWAIAFPAVGTINFFGILRGSCWLMHEGEAPQRIGAADGGGVVVVPGAHGAGIAGKGAGEDHAAGHRYPPSQPDA